MEYFKGKLPFGRAAFIVGDLDALLVSESAKIENEIKKGKSSKSKENK